MPDFQAPAQMMGQQLASIVNQSVVDQRAEAFLEAEQRQQIAKNFEVKANLAHSLMAVDAPKALELMNDGLSGFGVSLTMDQFNPAMKGFEVMADLTKQGDHQGAQLVLTSMKKNGLLVNLEDQRRAAELERQNTAAISQEQAQSVVALQFPDVAEAQQRVNAYRGFQQGQVDAPELARFYGSQDPTEIQQLFARDEARVQAFEAQAGIRQTLAKAFTLSPGLGEKAIAASASVVIDPALRAKARLGQLLEQPTRTEAEERELMSLGARYGSDALQQALNIKTAQREAKALEQDLNAISSRADTFSRVMGVIGTAERSISEQAAAREVIHPLEGDLPTDQAETVQQQHELATKRLDAEAQIFQQQTAPIKQQAEDQAQTNRQLMNDVAKRLVYALPGQKEELLKRKTEAEYVAKSSEALARLLDHESSYAIAQKEAALETLPEGVDRDTAQSEITNLKTARAKDLAVVGAEQERLLQRRKMLTAGMEKAEREADLERRITQASNVVDIARQKGLPVTGAMKEAAQQFDVPMPRLFKAVQEMGSLHEIDAQNEFAMLPPTQQTPQNAGKIGKKYGVPANKVLEGIKNPNKPMVEIHQNAPGERKDIAEGRSQLDMIGRIQSLYHPDFVGPLDARIGKLKSATGLIKEQEAEFRSAVKLMRTELRKFYFGAAQSKQELEGSLESIPDLDMSDEQFRASIKQTEANVKSMLSRRGEVMEQSGVRNPQPKSLEDRYKELEATGKSKTEIFEILRQEGY